MKKIVFYADAVNLNYPGYLKILNPLTERLGARIVTNNSEALDSSLKGEIVIPFGALTSYSSRKDGYKISYLIDSPRLCLSSVIVFHLKRHQFFTSEVWLNVLRYLKYAYYEAAIIKSYSTIILASKHDAACINRKYGNDKAVAIENGIDSADCIITAKATTSLFSFRLGYLNYWGPWRQHDFEWFANEIWPQCQLRYPQAQLIIAGRGATPELEKYFLDRGFKFMGAVDNLSEFFSEIDVFVTSIRKESGILNKILDAFAHQVPVLAFVNNAHPFRTESPFFYEYQNGEDFINALEHIRLNPEGVGDYVRRARAYLNEHHDWDKKAAELLRIVNAVYGDKA